MLQKSRADFYRLKSDTLEWLLRQNVVETGRGTGQLDIIAAHLKLSEGDLRAVCQGAMPIDTMLHSLAKYRSRQDADGDRQ